MFIHVFFLFPETAGKTLEETEAMFEDPQGIKYIGIPAWKTLVSKRARQIEHGDVESKLSFPTQNEEEKQKPEEYHDAGAEEKAA